MNSEEMLYKKVHDLGAAAYLMMNLFKPEEWQGKAIIFEVPADKVDLFYKTKSEYLRTEYHRFDACLVALKKMRNIDQDD